MSSNVSRRHLMQTGLAAAASAALSQDVKAQPAPKQIKTQSPTASTAATFEPMNRYPQMMQEYFVARVREIEKKSLERKAGLLTRAAALDYVQDVREKVRRCFGEFPAKTPLNPRITGTVDRETYTIEKVIFDSRPNFPVTANLYVPKQRTGKLPGVVGTCGHSPEGKAGETYQAFAQGLCKLGYVVLIYDPMGQGERMQIVDENLKPRFAGGTAEHLHAGVPQFLVGEFFGAWRAWDGIRALDYLLTRPEVDANHVALTGNSGGGTMTTWILSLEPRFTMGAAGCFVTTFRRNVENELPADTEQCPPRCLALGLDHDDFLAAAAPKPVAILAKEKDFFDVRGSIEANARLKHLYRLLGHEENAGLFIGPTPHGYSQEARESMYRWFNRAVGKPEVTSEPPITIEKQQTLWCTPHGQVAELKPRTLVGFTAEKSKMLAAKRGKVTGQKLIAAVKDVLKLPARSGDPYYRILRPRNRKYPVKGVSQYAVETERGIQIVVTRLGEEMLFSRPTQGVKRAVLYVSHLSADAELRDEPLITQLLEAEKNVPLYAMDVRGVGESRPDTCGANSFTNPYGSDYFYSAHSNMLDEPYIGRKTHDVLSVLDFLRSSGCEEVHLVGVGWGAVSAAFAGLLDDSVKQVTLKNAFTSYAAVAESVTYKMPVSLMPFGVLERFDLPDVYAALSSKKLRQMEPWNERAEVV